VELLGIADDDVAAGDSGPDVEPDVVGLRNLERQAVVLRVALPDQDLETLDQDRSEGPSLAGHEHLQVVAAQTIVADMETFPIVRHPAPDQRTPVLVRV